MNVDRTSRPLAVSELLIFFAVMPVMAATRLNHFGAVPDASWAMFFIGGFYLHAHWRWMFPLFLVNAVAIDYLVISGSGLNFWSHYCVSPGYWFLAPAYFSLWLGGFWAARAGKSLSLSLLLRSAAALIVSAAVCQLFAQGGFYWFSASVAEASMSGWWKNYSDWLPIYTQVMAIYLGIAAVIHCLLSLVFANDQIAVAPAKKLS